MMESDDNRKAEDTSSGIIKKKLIKHEREQI